MTPTSTTEMKYGRNITLWLIFLKYFSRISLSMTANAICEDVAQHDEGQVVEHRVASSAATAGPT